jgi:hypothetical protein
MTFKTHVWPIKRLETLEGAAARLVSAKSQELLNPLTKRPPKTLKSLLKSLLKRYKNRLKITLLSSFSIPIFNRGYLTQENSSG